MEWAIGKTLGALLSPPGFLILALLAAFLLTWRRPPIARALTLVVVIVLYALSTPLVAVSLLQMLQPPLHNPASDRSGDGRGGY